jgi:hypothetical protein
VDVRSIVDWVFPGVAVPVGIGLLLVQIDREKLREKMHTNPLLALYRFRVWRYTMAATCFILAAVTFFELPR